MLYALKDKNWVSWFSLQTWSFLKISFFNTILIKEMCMLIKYEGVVNVFNENIHKSHFRGFFLMSHNFQHDLLVFSFCEIYCLVHNTKKMWVFRNFSLEERFWCFFQKPSTPSPAPQHFVLSTWAYSFIFEYCVVWIFLQLKLKIVSHINQQ